MVELHSGFAYSNIITFDDDDLTPSVAGGCIFKTATGNAGGINVTMFDDGVAGQVIFIIASNPANKTTVIDGGNLLINANWLEAAERTLVLIFDGVNWYEICRR